MGEGNDSEVKQSVRVRAIVHHNHVPEEQWSTLQHAQGKGGREHIGMGTRVLVWAASMRCVVLMSSHPIEVGRQE